MPKDCPRWAMLCGADARLQPKAGGLWRMRVARGQEGATSTHLSLHLRTMQGLISSVTSIENAASQQTHTAHELVFLVGCAERRLRSYGLCPSARAVHDLRSLGGATAVMHVTCAHTHAGLSTLRLLPLPTARVQVRLAASFFTVFNPAPLHGRRCWRDVIQVEMGWQSPT